MNPYLTALRAGGVAVASAVMLLGCAGVAQWQEPGALRADVVARMGAPTAVYDLPQHGQRLQYSQQPAGTQVHNFDFDAAGRLVSVEQALQPEVIAQIELDRWTGVDVMRLLGKPGLVEHVSRFEGDVWTYRFADPTGLRRRLHVHLDRAGLVRQVLTTDEIYRSDRGVR